MAELEDILMELFASNKLEAVKEAEAKLLSWRDNHTAKIVRERLENTDLDWQIGPVTVHYLPLHIIDRLTTNSKEEEQCQIG